MTAGGPNQSCPLTTLCLLFLLCFIQFPVHYASVSSNKNDHLASHLIVAQHSRFLSLIANSIPCSASVNNVTGSFCGSKSIANYTVFSANSFYKASSFKAILGNSPSYGVQQYVIKYKTQLSQNGPLIDATGIVAMPVVGSIKAPTNGFAVVMFGHYTVGIDDYYAPSQTLAQNTDVTFSYVMSYLRNYAAYGFIVVLPDYSGLGVPNIPHYYLVKKPTAYSIIDSVRAAIAFAKKLGLTVSPRTVFAGHSQGGCAVLQAQEIYSGTEGYGNSSFTLSGVVAIAPAPVWRFALHDTYDYYNQELATVVSLYFWAASKYNSKLNLTELLSNLSITAIDTYAESLSSDKLETGNFFPANATDFLSSSSGIQDAINSNINGYYCYTNNTQCQGGASSPYNLTVMTLTGLSKDWQDQFDEDSPGLALFSSVPVLLLQGSKDTTVRPYNTIMLAQSLMNNGVPVVDKTGKAIVWNGATDVSKEFKITSNCTNTNGTIVTCGQTHQSILLSVDLHIPFIFSKGGLMPTGPTRKPSRKPSKRPSKKPTRKPSRRPTKKPLAKPSRRPTKNPLAKPSKRPTRKPSRRPTKKPLAKPSKRPTKRPSIKK